MIRGVLAVLAGFAVFGVAIIAMGVLTGPVDAFGTLGMVLWVAWEVIGMALAGYTIALVAPRAPATYAVIMGALQTLLTLWAFVMVREPSSPAWFWTSAMVLMTPGAWLGATLRRITTWRSGTKTIDSRRLIAVDLPKP